MRSSDLPENCPYKHRFWAPEIHKINGKYHLFHAAIYRDKNHPDWLGYHTGVAVADSVLGPYQKDSRGRIFEGGHLAVFDGPDGGRWFSYRGEARNQARGLLCADPFDLDILVVEYSAPDGPAIKTILRSLPAGKGGGSFIWEPTHPGHGKLFDHNGAALPALREYP